MDEKSNPSSLRRYNFLDNNESQELLIPISIDHFSTHKRRRGEQTQIASNNPDLISNRTENRKRSAEDDLLPYSTHHFLREHEQSTPKRARYEHSNSIELENQPPRSIPKRRSLLFHHPQQEQDLLSSTWNNLRSSNEFPLFFNEILPTTYHLSDHYSPLLPDHHHSSIFHENSLITTQQKTNMRLLSSQSNGSNALRTTNVFFDNKQQTILRTGNISPAHSDSSSESTSTCSSDDQLHHHHSHIHQPQPWRTYRERENYEQLLDLAEKLADPNRSNQVDIQQFFSYRYKISTLTSKQTACVICMSHFKNNQHIRVLPCQHEYHSKCIARWFTMNSSCPICRRDNFLSSC
jgi:hypothetical protein